MIRTHNHKFAILTCGGVCPGMNDVIRSITMRSHQRNVHDVFGIRYGFRGLNRIHQEGSQENIRLTPYNTHHIHLCGGTILGTSRDPLHPERAVQTLIYEDISTVFIIGGNGGNKAASVLHETLQREKLPVQVIALPKSIDNDIDCIDQCFGFDTAVQELSKILRIARNEANAVPRGISIVQTMGRDSGFIAHDARGADIRLIPEDPYMEDDIINEVQRLIDTRQSVVICIAEGYPIHSNKIQELLRYRIKNSYVKYIDPSYLIRGGITSDVDHKYCTLLGEAAVDAALSGRSGITVATKNGVIHHFNTKDITKNVKFCRGEWKERRLHMAHSTKFLKN